MAEKLMDKIRNELDEWKTSLDEMRVKGNLTAMELRDKLDGFRRAYWRAKGRLEAIGELQAERWAAACKAMEESWDELRSTYREERQRLRDERGSSETND